MTLDITTAVMSVRLIIAISRTNRSVGILAHVVGCNFGRLRAIIEMVLVVHLNVKSVWELTSFSTGFPFQKNLVVGGTKSWKEYFPEAMAPSPNERCWKKLPFIFSIQYCSRKYPRLIGFGNPTWSLDTAWCTDFYDKLLTDWHTNRWSW